MVVPSSATNSLKGPGFFQSVRRSKEGKSARVRLERNEEEGVLTSEADVSLSFRSSSAIDNDSDDAEAKRKDP